MLPTSRQRGHNTACAPALPGRFRHPQFLGSEPTPLVYPLPFCTQDKVRQMPGEVVKNSHVYRSLQIRRFVTLCNLAIQGFCQPTF
jgi:hypothetical protein